MLKAFHSFAGLAAVTLLVASPAAGQSPNTPSADEPTVIAAVAPVFPPIARSAHAKGSVIVEVTIGSDGAVATTKSLSGHPLLQRASETAAKKWKFASTNEVSRKARLVFAFDYIDGSKSDPESTITFMPPCKVEVIWNLGRTVIEN